MIDQWAAALRAAGIQRDRRPNHRRRSGASTTRASATGWSWDYLQFGYAAPVGALQFNENIATLTVRPAAQAGDPANVTLSPGAGFALLNRASTGAQGSRSTIDYRRQLDQPVLEVSGSIAAGCHDRSTRTVAVVNPTLFFAQSLKDGLIERGIARQRRCGRLRRRRGRAPGGIARTPRAGGDAVSAAARDRDGADEGQPEPVRRDAPEGDRRRARRAGNASRRAARRAAALCAVGRAGRCLRHRRRLRPVALQLPDAPTTITAVLERMYKDDRHRDAFVATLPIAGKDGTSHADARHARRGQRRREDGIDLERARRCPATSGRATARCWSSRSSPTTS